jgi:hypothetical protein
MWVGAVCFNLSRDLIDIILFFVCSVMKATTTLTARPITRSVMKVLYSQ